MIIFLVVLTLACWVPLLYMLSDDGRTQVIAAVPSFASTPVVTFDSRGLV